MEDEVAFPSPPTISEDDLRYCRETGDFAPALFEWYKFVGLLTNFFASIRLDSPAIGSIRPEHYYLLIGLLNRCARLMHSNVALSHDRLFGETTAIIDRCIFESALTVQWICAGPVEERANRYMANGLKTEIEFKSLIESNIEKRAGRPWAIEARMLQSIANYIASSKLSHDEIASSKKMPDTASILESLGQNRLTYVIYQRIGSHHVHGTWPSLLTHYLDEVEPGHFSPRDHDCETHVNQFTYISLAVLDALDAFAKCMFEDANDVTTIVNFCSIARTEVIKLFEEMSEADK